MHLEAEQRCPNCRKPLTKHRPWCEKVKTIEPSKQGDIINHPVFGPTELVSVYSREQAIEDGVLIDCTEDPFDELNRRAGLIFDVAMTSAVFHRYVEVPEQFQGSQDIGARYWDILRLFLYAVHQSEGDGDELLFEFACFPNGDADFEVNERDVVGGRNRIVQLKAVTGPGDRGEPCLTLMLPSED
jgi:hypothetical protein